MHPQRIARHTELHARPSLYFDGPAHVFHLALLGGHAACQALLPRSARPDAAQVINSVLVLVLLVILLRIHKAKQH
jgi:hypothetical protein